MQLVSIVVPIYNVELYLNQCISSIVNQTYANLEIILVNDGSTDNSKSIAESYANNDKRIKLINKPNGGLSDARNVGTQKCTGEWLFYLDSDDYIKHDAIERLITFANIHDCDVVQGGFYYLFPQHMLLDTKYGETKEILTKFEALELLIENRKIKDFAWGKLYKTNLVKKIIFPKGRFFEDTFWQYKIIDSCNKYGVIKDALTYYRQRKGAISENAAERIFDLLDGYTDRYTYLLSKYPQLVQKSLICLWHSHFSVCYYKRKSTSFKQRLDSFIHKYNQSLDLLLKHDARYQLYKNHNYFMISILDLKSKIYNRLFNKPTIIKLTINNPIF